MLNKSSNYFGFTLFLKFCPYLEFLYLIRKDNFSTLFRLEKIKMKTIRSQAKVVGTLATVSGAMVMTLMKGPVLFGTHGSNINNQHNSGPNTQHAVAGSIMIVIGCFSWACFVILQVS